MKVKDFPCLPRYEHVPEFYLPAVELAEFTMKNGYSVVAYVAGISRFKDHSNRFSPSLDQLIFDYNIDKRGMIQEHTDSLMKCKNYRGACLGEIVDYRVIRKLKKKS